MADKPPPREDPFGSLLAQRHAAIVRGDSDSNGSESSGSTVPPFQSRLKRVEACLRSLENLRCAALNDASESGSSSASSFGHDFFDSSRCTKPGESLTTFGRFQIVRDLGHGGPGIRLSGA
jgi:hypothetical protein